MYMHSCLYSIAVNITVLWTILFPAIIPGAGEAAECAGDLSSGMANATCTHIVTIFVAHFAGIHRILNQLVVEKNIFPLIIILHRISS